MFDVWIGEIDLTTLILILSVLILFPCQLLLCFKVKSVVLQLLPCVVLFLATAILFVFAIAIADGWDALGYLFLAIFTGIMLLACGLAWLIWAVAKLVAHIRKKQVNNKNRQI